MSSVYGTWTCVFPSRLFFWGATFRWTTGKYLKIGDQLDVSENSGTPKSSNLMGFSIINHPFWGTPIFGNTQLVLKDLFGSSLLTLECNIHN